MLRRGLYRGSWAHVTKRGFLYKEHKGKHERLSCFSSEYSQRLQAAKICNDAGIEIVQSVVAQVSMMEVASQSASVNNKATTNRVRSEV